MDRDYSLDFMKGIACVLMLLAHYYVLPVNTSYVQQIVSFYLNFIGGLAPILFFAISGVTSLFQSRKNIKTIIVFYIVFALIGLSYNMIIRPHLYVEWVCDIPQIIAIAVIIIILLEKYMHPKKEIYILSGILIFLIHYFITKNIPSFPGKQLLFAPGVFPVFPWLFVFFMGIFAYKADKLTNLLCSIAALSLLIALYLSHKINLDLYNKFDMSIGYFLISTFFLFLMFYLYRKIQIKTYSNKNIILFYGKYSLLFLYMHFYLIGLFTNFKLNIFLSYILILLLTYILMRLLLIINTYMEKAFENYIIWSIMLALIFIIPLMKSLVVIQYINFILGFLFAGNYHTLSKLIQQRFEKKLPD